MNPVANISNARSRLARTGAAVAWAAVVAVLTSILFILTRGCDYDLAAVARYGTYFALHVVLPGVVVLAAVQRGSVGLTAAIAWGIPTGFAVEIFSFLACAALGVKPLVPWLPIGWLALAVSWSATHATPLVRWRVTARHAGVALALSLVFLATAVAAATNMFLESPLDHGLPQRPIFHDWVYLVSRAAAIKQHWPLEDPSLAGTPLQYHYFMLVHAASASLVTGSEITLVLLRLAIVPLGAVVVLQMYALGRRLSRSPWGGVLAAVLALVTGELAFAPDAQHSVFVGRFVRWLYVSPTFYFGVIFFAALVFAVERWHRLRRVRLPDIAWLALLGAGAAGAKGTVVPVVLVALAAWALHEAWRDRRVPWRLAAAGVSLAVPFGVVYLATMAQLRSGAAFAPADVLEVASFWQQQFPEWRAWLAQALPPTLAGALATLACSVVVVAGTEGVRLLALPCLLGRPVAAERSLTAWIGATLVASAGLGLVLRMDADSELYVFLLSRLPAAILAAAFLVRAVPRFRRWQSVVAAATGGGFASWRRWRLRLPWLAVAAVGGAMIVQVTGWFERKHGPFEEWIRIAPTAPGDADLQRLEEALLWIRNHTEPDAILVANTCTGPNLRVDHWGAVDHTLAGVHYYYSAISERRMLVEGPLYLLDPVRATRRIEITSAAFYARQRPAASVLHATPCYLVLDRSVHDAAPIALAPGRRVFANRRVEVYRLPREPAPLAAN